MLVFETIGFVGNPTLIAQAEGILVGTWRQTLQECGRIIVRHIREVLGTSEVYTIKNRKYAAKKASGAVEGMKRFSNKAADQPLILTGAMYQAIASQVRGNSIVVGVLPRETSGRFAAFRPEDYISGFDDVDSYDFEAGGSGRVALYAEIWNNLTGFVARGVHNAMPECEAHLQSRMDRALQTLVTAVGG